MNTKHFTTSLAVFALLAGSGVLRAAEESSGFKTLDADGNGYISAEEAAANQSLSARWGDLDKDKNNQLDQSEFSAFESGGMMQEGGGMMQEGGGMQKGTMSPGMPEK